MPKDKNGPAGDPPSWPQSAMVSVEGEARAFIARASPAVLEQLKRGMGYVASAMPDAVAHGLDNYNPAYLGNIYDHPESAWRYASQRAEQVFRGVKLVMHPTEAFWQAIGGGRELVRRLALYHDMLDPGRKVRHTGLAAADLMLDRAGDAIAGTAMVASYVYRARNREKTRQMMDRVFPTDRMYGRFFRRPIPRLLFAKPTARVLAMPGFFASFLTYRELVMLGQQIDAREGLAVNNPDLFRSLEISDRDWLDAARHEGILEAIKGTSINTSPLLRKTPGPPKTPGWPAVAPAQGIAEPVAERPLVPALKGATFPDMRPPFSGPRQ